MRPSSPFAHRTMRPVGRLALAWSLAALVAACSGPDESPDAGNEEERDGSSFVDGGEDGFDGGGDEFDGGLPFDAGNEPDAGAPPGSCGGTLGSCPSGESCVYPEGAECGARLWGKCEPSPESCPSVENDPQCGCDGFTYESACQAALFGAAIAHPGACVNPNCGARDVAGVGDCDTGLGFAWDGEACAEVSGCDCTGDDCGFLTTREICEADYIGRGCLQPPACASSAECEPDELCSFPMQDLCGATMTGTCVPRPTFECSTLKDPVCGCDGKPYDNDCQAWAEGISVDYKGPCAPPACRAQSAQGAFEGDDEPSSQGFAWNGTACFEVLGTSCVGAACAGLPTTMEACEAAYTTAGCLTPRSCDGGELGCGAGYYCDYPDTDTCGGSGVCKRIPTECPDEEAPVCGCNGFDYPNACEAARDSEDVASVGKCLLSCPAQDAAGAGGGSNVLGYRWDGSACVEMTGATCEGADCVCKDDVCAAPYPDLSDCEYKSAEARCMHMQPCGGSGHQACPSDRFCDYPDDVGGCKVSGATGVCVLRPLASSCPMSDEESFCGCDDVTYPTACDARAAGFDVASLGACEP